VGHRSCAGAVHAGDGRRCRVDRPHRGARTLVWARVIDLPAAGYGRACRTGAQANPGADVITFVNGDFSEDPAAIDTLVAPILADQADLVLGWRTGRSQPWLLWTATRFGVSLVRSHQFRRQCRDETLGLTPNGACNGVD
jgi:hypothetical protein